MPHQTADSTGFYAQLRQDLSFSYPDGNEDLLVGKVAAIFDGFDRRVPLTLAQIWSQQDAMLITYGDSVRKTDQRPLQTLAQFLQNRVGGAFSSVHILPFCPYQFRRWIRRH